MAKHGKRDISCRLSLKRSEEVRAAAVVLLTEERREVRAAVVLLRGVRVRLGAGPILFLWNCVWQRKRGSDCGEKG